MAMLRRLSLLALILISFPGAVLAGDIQGQKPVMFVGDTFQFVPGAWASYYVHDKGKDEHYVMHMATLEKLKQDGKQCSWMEIEMLPESGPSVVTRLLVEETKRGPGDLLEVIVQVKGYSPFTVPKKYYEGENKEVGEFHATQIAKRIARRTFGAQVIVVYSVDSAIDRNRFAPLPATANSPACTSSPDVLRSPSTARSRNRNTSGAQTAPFNICGQSVLPIQPESANAAPA